VNFSPTFLEFDLDFCLEAASLFLLLGFERRRLGLTDYKSSRIKFYGVWNTEGSLTATSSVGAMFNTSVGATTGFLREGSNSGPPIIKWS